MRRGRLRPRHSRLTATAASIRTSSLHASSSGQLAARPPNPSRASTRSEGITSAQCPESPQVVPQLLVLLGRGRARAQQAHLLPHEGVRDLGEGSREGRPGLDPPGAVVVLVKANVARRARRVLEVLHKHREAEQLRHVPEDHKDLHRDGLDLVPPAAAAPRVERDRADADREHHEVKQVGQLREEGPPLGGGADGDLEGKGEGDEHVQGHDHRGGARLEEQQSEHHRVQQNERAVERLVLARVEQAVAHDGHALREARIVVCEHLPRAEAAKNPRHA
eukprot:CAMPEP_0206012540 /NCGR_PEP_ID=MMETSP1464-20131121/15032_1 /ASSEMBLY_ACC=CAM_ASM_001124 /TAXON_ID=119497 /ORGANISM="Exanthemachrysis gayraliae, Strain RCC1523" /LENGTH=277 /DNA_ID=CAMNT_0053386229 /DNA_START=126 /DNA_END=956 /DNA_ORIENTATION=+